MVDARPLVLVPERAAPRPWGFWTTVGLSLAVLAIFEMLQFVTGIGLLLVSGAGSDDLLWTTTATQTDRRAVLVSSGLFLSVGALVADPICGGLVVLFAWLRRSLPIKEYLGLRLPALRATGLWLLFVALFILWNDVLAYLHGRPIVPTPMVRTYETAGSRLLFFLVLFLLAPVFEELLFRGFMLPKLRRSFLGSAGALVLSSLAWSFIHHGSGLSAMVLVFCTGVLLGAARLRTGSTYLTMIMHAFMNVVLTAQLLIWLHLSRPG